MIKKDKPAKLPTWFGGAADKLKGTKFYLKLKDVVNSIKEWPVFRRKHYVSLYIGLLAATVLGIVAAVGVYALLQVTATYIIDTAYTTEERMMLDIRVMRGGKVISENLALNDAVISNGSMARVAELDVLADNELVTEVTGDGVIVATPTGSTAYSMSAGGPIVEPTSSCIIITPVCAHQLSARAMVLSAERKVAVQLPKGSRKHLFLSVDGQGRFICQGKGRMTMQPFTPE